MRRVAIGAVASVLTALATAGCSLPDISQMNFRADNRLHFVSPKDGSKVNQPVVLRWTMHHFTVVPPSSAPPSRSAGYFAIFVDQQPIAPGASMRSVAKGDRFCVPSRHCPDAAYLAQRQIYTTTSTIFLLPQVRALAGDGGKVQLHRIVVVLMDTSGHRIGESNWELDLRIRTVGG